LRRRLPRPRGASLAFVPPPELSGAGRLRPQLLKPVLRDFGQGVLVLHISKTRRDPSVWREICAEAAILQTQLRPLYALGLKERILFRVAKFLISKAPLVIDPGKKFVGVDEVGLLPLSLVRSFTRRLYLVRSSMLANASLPL
jgi:hypothetical protein